MSEEFQKDECAFLREEVAHLRRRLHELSSPLGTLLKRRGIRIFSKEPAEDVLLPSKKYLDAFYSMLGRYSFRLFLRDVIKHQDFFTLPMVTRYATAGVTEDYIAYLRSIRLIRKKGGGYALSRRPVKSFGETLEWYVTEVFSREFSAEAVRGVKFKGRRTGGDYDVVARMDGMVCYVEVKSSPPKQIYDREIAAFLDRVVDLAPEMAIFLMDTELRMKDKIVPMFEEELAQRGKRALTVERIERELFRAGHRIFIINAKDSISGNIGNVLSRYIRWRNEISPPGS